MRIRLPFFPESSSQSKFIPHSDSMSSFRVNRYENNSLSEMLSPASMSSRVFAMMMLTPVLPVPKTTP